MNNFWEGFEKRAAALNVGAIKGLASRMGAGAKSLGKDMLAHPSTQGALDVVRKNPIKSTAIAGGVGLGAGYMASNNKQPRY